MEEEGIEGASTLAIKKTIFDYVTKDINGQDIPLSKYKGRVLLIVNVASASANTQDNYKNLEELHRKYKDKPFSILAFPCNQFAFQEPGDEDAIKDFAKNMDITFDVFSKVKVNGEQAHPLWKFLRTSVPGPMGEFIKWNFTKFLVDTNGIPVRRFAPEESFDKIEKAVKQLL